MKARLLFIVWLLPVMLFAQSIHLCNGRVTITRNGEILRKNNYSIMGGFQNASTTIHIPSGWVLVRNGAGDLWKVDEQDGMRMVQDTLRVDHKGVYAGIVTLCMSSKGTIKYNLRLWNVTEGEQEGYVTSALSSGQSGGTLVMPIRIAADDSAKIVLQISNDQNKDVIVHHGAYQIYYTHE